MNKLMQHRIVDTHVHIWNFSKAKYAWLTGNTSMLNRNYELDELESERKLAGITDGVLVQAANNFADTDYMLEVASGSDWIKGVVGWLPLMHPEETGRVLNETYYSNPYFKGVRHLIHDEPDAQWLLQDSVIESLKSLATYNLTYDLVAVLPAHMETALRVAEKVPSLKMTLDHMSQPPVNSKEEFGRWGNLMKSASANKNFYVKISGLGTAASKKDWSKEDIKPYIEYVLTHFGADRCFCGGDWPVSLLAASYTRTWAIYKEALEELLSEKDLSKVHYENAVNFYRLK